MQCRRPYINLGITQFMAGGGIVLLGILLIPQLATLFPAA